MWRAVSALLRKEGRLELRTFQVIPAMALFSVTTLVVFHFSLQRDAVDGTLAGGVLTITLLFSALLGISRLFAASRRRTASTASCWRRWTARRCSSPRRWRSSA